MRRGIWIAGLVLGIGTAASLAAVSPPAKAFLKAGDPAPLPPPSPPVVMVTTARLDRDAAVRRLPGTIAARDDADLGFRVEGKILTRPVSVGDTVAAGDVVASLDDTDLRLQLAAAEAAQAAARVALDKAEIDLNRVTTLESKGWASSKATDDNTVATEELRSRLLQADRNVDLAQNRLGYATLRADGPGVVTATTADAGQVVAAGQPVVQVARSGAREALVAIPEAMVAGIRDATAEVELWSAPGQHYPAALRELSPLADPVTRTFAARFTLPDAAAGAALGMSVTVTLTRPGVAPGTEIPLSALLDTGNGPTVWVVGADGRLESRPVSVADYAAGTARVTAGLADGDRVVVLGAPKLLAGETVRPQPVEG